MAVEALSSPARRPAVDDTALAQASFATEAQRTLREIPVRLELLNPTINRALPQNGFERAADGFWRPLRQLLGTDDPLNNNQTAHVRYWAGKAGLEVSPQGTIDLPNTRDGGRLLATMNFQEIGYSGSFSNGRPGGMLDFEQLKRQQGMSPDFVAGYEEAANQIKTGQAFAWLQLLASGAVSLATARPQPTTVIVEQGPMVRPPAGGLGGQTPRPPIQLTETFPGSGVYARPGQTGGPIQTSPGGGLAKPGGNPGGLVPSRPAVPPGVAAGAPTSPTGIAPTPSIPSTPPAAASKPIYGPGNPEGVAQAAQAADAARRQLQTELNGLSQSIPIPSADGVNKVSFGGFTWADAQGRAAEYNNGRADGTIAVPVPYERRYNTQGGVQERREPTVYVGGPVQILNAVAKDKAAGRVAGDYDVRGQAAQVGAPNFDELVAADVANRAYAIESNAPTTLYGNTAVPFPTRADAARAAQAFNGSSSGADPVALAVPLEVRVQGPGVDRTAVVSSVYPGSPDQMSAYFNEMKRQGRIPDGVTFDQCLKDSGIGGSYPARVSAAHDLRAAEAEVKSPTTLFESTVGVRPTKGEAVNYAVHHNAGTSGADQVVLYVPLTRDVSGPPGVSGRGTAHTLYQNTPDKLPGFVDEMKRQGRVPGDVSFEDLLEESGLAGSFPERLDASRPPVTVRPQTPAPITAPSRPSPPLAATTPGDPPPPGTPPVPETPNTPPQTPPQTPAGPPPLVPQPPTGGVDPITGLTPAAPLTSLTEARSYLRQFGMDIDDTPFPGSPGRHSNAEIAELVTAIRPEIERLAARYPGLLDGVKISTHAPSSGVAGDERQTAAEVVGAVVAFRDPGFLNAKLPKHGVTIGDIFRHEMGHVTWNKTSR
jgi:hypothetical protein